MMIDIYSLKYAQERTVFSRLVRAMIRRLPIISTKAWAFVLIVFGACMCLTATTLAQTTDPASVFSDLSTDYDGGVANPTDGSTGNVLQQTLLAAYFWGQAHGGARATVVVSSEYPILGSNILVPGNVSLVCSSYSPETYNGGCQIKQSDPGNNTAAGGSPLLIADYRIGVLPDHKTWCSSSDTPQQPGCTIINSSGASISGFTLYGRSYLGGGTDIGIRIFADSVHVQDTNESFFGGPGIQILGGLNDSVDWNFGTNLDMWWCANPSHLATLGKSLGGLDLGMIDGEASHNQYSTGCAFTKSFAVALEYPYIAAMNVGGAGNLIQSNLLQADGIGLNLGGGEHRVVDNRVEFQGREAIRTNAYNSLFANNRIVSACLDPNLANLMPGAIDNGIPQYPRSPTFLHTGHIIMDPNGNIEDVISGAGTSDSSAPDWPIQLGDTTEGDALTWENIGPWKSGLTDVTDSGTVPALVSGLCYAVLDMGQHNNWSDNEVAEDVGLNGPSYLRGSYDIWSPGSLTGNTCDGDLPDAYGNRQCWWGGDLFANGGPGYLAPNGQSVTASGGGTAWVGDYSVLVLADNVTRRYSNLQGMSKGQQFSITSSTVAELIDPWSIDGHGGSVYGHPSLKTCTGESLVIMPGSYYSFYYNPSSQYAVTQTNCPTGSGAASFVAVSPTTLDFGSQIDGTASSVKTVTVTNVSSTALSLLILSSDDFAQSSNCTSATLAVGSSCTISVSFSPIVAGAHAGILTIASSDSGLSQAVTLTGTGAESSGTTQPNGPSATIALTSSVAELWMPASGHPATATLTAVPQNGFTGTVDLTCQVMPQGQLQQVEAPTCSLSSSRMTISNNIEAKSALLLSAQASQSSSITSRPVLHHRGISLAGLTLLGLFPLGLLRRKSYIILLSIICLIGVGGCGYTPNNPSGSSYRLVITASSGTRTLASITIPVRVQ